MHLRQCCLGCSSSWMENSMDSYQFVSLQIHLKLLLGWYCQQRSPVEMIPRSLFWRQQALWVEGLVLLCVECRNFPAAYSSARWQAMLSAECLHFSIPSAVIEGAQEHSALQRIKSVISSGVFREKKITIESLWKPLVFNDLSAPFYCVLLEKTFNLF